MTPILMLDTSAVLALVVDGPHRDVMLEAMGEFAMAAASAMALTEAIPTIDRLTDQQLQREDLEDEIRRLWDHLFVVPLDSRCMEDASRLARQHSMRICDAIHLSAAGRLPGPVTLATVDPSQIPIALELGFEVWST